MKYGYSFKNVIWPLNWVCISYRVLRIAYRAVGIGFELGLNWVCFGILLALIGFELALIGFDWL